MLSETAAVINYMIWLPCSRDRHKLLDEYLQDSDVNTVSFKTDTPKHLRQPQHYRTEYKQSWFHMETSEFARYEFGCKQGQCASLSWQLSFPAFCLLKLVSSWFQPFTANLPSISISAEDAHSPISTSPPSFSGPSSSPIVQFRDRIKTYWVLEPTQTHEKPLFLSQHVQPGKSFSMHGLSGYPKCQECSPSLCQ